MRYEDLEEMDDKIIPKNEVVHLIDPLGYGYALCGKRLKPGMWYRDGIMGSTCNCCINGATKLGERKLFLDSLSRK